MSILLFFIDGLGLGTDDAESNPVARVRLRRLRVLRDRASPDPEAHFVATDARLGVPGLPQSATGQAAILLERNPVPTLVWGRGAAEAAARTRSLADIAPAILRRLDVVC